MGVTIECKKTGASCDLTYCGFEKLREVIANRFNPEFGEHYAKLLSPEMLYCSDEKEKEQMYADFDKETERLIKKHKLSLRVISFFFQSDCGGKISPTACKKIYSVIKDYDDNKCYGYMGLPDYAMFKHIKQIFKECSETNSYFVWW